MARIDLGIYAINPRSERSGAWDTGWRVLPSVLLEVPYDGAWRCDVEGGRLDVREGEALLLPAGLRHRLRNRPGASMRSSWAYIDWRDERPLPLPDQPLVITTRELAVDDLIQTGEGPRDEIRRQRATWQLLDLLARRCPLEEPAIDPRIARVLHWCEGHLHQPIDRKRLAVLADLSPTRFHAVFSAATGQAPMRWLAATRLRRAQQLLLGGSLPIGAIAERCGYASPYYFSRAFRQATGQTPTHYRQLNKK